MPGVMKVSFISTLDVTYFEFFSTLTISSFFFNYLFIIKGKYLRMLTSDKK
jgi:hypothetical protein